MDCPICYNKIENSAIGSCTHHFCLNCLINWCRHGGETCPICKTTIEVIRQDIEFDKLNGCVVTKLEKINSTLDINFYKETSAGITLENNYSLFKKRLAGVRICKIEKDKQCYKSGLRIGNVILFINKIPCVNHEQVIKIFDNLIKSNSIASLVLK